MRVIAQLSDMHLGERLEENVETDPWENLVRVLEDVKNRGIRELVITGDICSRDVAGQLNELLERYELEYRLVPGNHDDPTVLMDVLGMENNYYSYRDSYYRYIFLDSSRGVIDEAQLVWLRGELSKAKEQAVVIFIHHPILDCDNSIMDRLYPLLNRGELEQMLNASGCKTMVFCGHYHRNDIREKGNIKQYIAPSTFYQLKQHGDRLEVDNSPIGYRMILIDEDIDTNLITIDI